MRMVRPEDVVEAVTWYCGVNPTDPKLTRRVIHARRVAYATMHDRLDMGVDDIAQFFGRERANTHKSMTSEQITKEVLDSVMERAGLMVHQEEQGERQAQKLAQLEQELAS